MSRTICVLAVCAGCTSYTPEVSAWFTRAEIHVDAARPTELAISDLELQLTGGEEGRYVRLDRVTLIPPDERRIPIKLTLADGDPLYVPAYVQFHEQLINEDARNEQLVSHCQSKVPILVELSFPGHRDMMGPWVWEEDLVVFCP